MKILFVCTGNTCRSPMAQILFDNICKKNGRGDIIVRSVGLQACEGVPMMETARAALKRCKEKVGRKKMVATRFRYEMVDEYDWVITMTDVHAQTIGPYNNVKSLGAMVGCSDIADPYMQPIDVYVAVCKQLRDALSELYRRIV